MVLTRTSPDIYDLPANRIWHKWAAENIEKGPPFGNNHYRSRWNKNVANEAKQGYNREEFEKFLIQNGCYLEVKNGKPEIKGFDEASLTMLLLKWL